MARGLELTPREQALSVDLRKPPKAIGQWQRVMIKGGSYLANLGIEIEGEPPDAIIKWVAVVYADPNSGATYFRGESLQTMDDAIEAAASLMPDPEPVVHEHVFTAWAAMASDQAPLRRVCACGELEP